MDDVLALGWLVWGGLALAAFAGTIVQRLAGQGFGMLISPTMALLAPEFLPSAVLLLGLIVGFGSISFELSALNKSELPAGFAGRTVGAVLAAWIAVTVVQSGEIAPLVAGMVYLGIILSLLGVRVAIRPVSVFIGSVVSGIMGTLTAVGAPPMALLYQHEEARRSAAMQNAFFAFGMIVSIGALLVAGLVGLRHLMLAVSLVPFVFLGLRAAQPIAKHVAKSSIRPYALGLAGCAATILLTKYLLSLSNS